MNTEEKTLQEISNELKEEIGVGPIAIFIVPIATAIIFYMWINTYFSTGTSLLLSLLAWLSATAGVARAGMDEIAKKANQTIIRQAGK